MSQVENVLDSEGGRKDIKKEKGVKKCVIKKQIMHEQYKETLLGAKQLWHGMNILQSEGHEIYGMHVNKISLSAFDSKRWIADDGIHTNAYGYIRPLLTDAVTESLGGLTADAEIESHRGLAAVIEALLTDADLLTAFC